MRVEAVCSFFLSFFSALALSSSVSVARASATPTPVAACLPMLAWLASFALPTGLLAYLLACLLTRGSRLGPQRSLRFAVDFFCV